MTHDGHPNLRLAVVICTRDRPTSLLATLESVWNQTRLPDELIIVDDGNLASDTRAAIAGRCDELRIVFSIIENGHEGLTRGRNRAADAARSDVVLYLDDDVTCAADCIARIAALFADPRVTGVTACVEEPTLQTRSSRLYQICYRVAGWWRVRPRCHARIPAPAILRQREIAVEARWLSGAAMALRTEVVRAHRFDEMLTHYALGEDREMGYRLSARHWLLEGRRARVVHRRDTSQRTDSRRLGFMTAHNYLYILHKTCRLGVGDWALIAWSLSVLMAMHLAWALPGNRRGHLLELVGMAEGIASWCREQWQRVGRPHLRQTTQDDAKTVSEVRSRNRKRVLFVTNRLEPGGAELMLVNLVKYLPSRGVDPLILCLKDAGPLAPQCRETGTPVFEGLLHHKTDASVIPRIRRLLEIERIDAVVVAHSGGDRMFWSTLAAGFSRVPVVVWSHWFPRAGLRHFERANRAIFRWVEAYVALGWRHRAALIRHENVPAGRISVIPNGLDLPRFMNNPSREDARRRLRLEFDQVGIALVANLRQEKRHDVFINAARVLAAEDRRLRFFIIGDGPDRDAVQRAAERSGLDHEVLRILGARDDVPDLLSGLDISCLCSDVECFSVSMLEAAAAGCVFVAPNTGCLPEFLEHRRMGLLIRPGSVDDLIGALRELAGDAAMRSALAQAARERVMKEFGMERVADQFAELIRGLPGRGRSGSDPRRYAKRASRRIMEPASV